MRPACRAGRARAGNTTYRPPGAASAPSCPRLRGRVPTGTPGASCQHCPRLSQGQPHPAQPLRPQQPESPWGPVSQGSCVGLVQDLGREGGTKMNQQPGADPSPCPELSVPGGTALHPKRAPLGCKATLVLEQCTPSPRGLGMGVGLERSRWPRPQEARGEGAALGSSPHCKEEKQTRSRPEPPGAAAARSARSRQGRSRG